MIITLSDNGFDTMDPIHIETGLGIVIAVCLAIAAALVILVVWLSRPNRKPTKKPIMDVMMRPRARRYGTNASMMWLPVTPRAILRGRTRSLLLAAIARDFASAATGSDVRSQTLTDIEATPRTTGNQHGLTLLRQTIEALYPPEFADAERNHTAREATVEQAGEWVANLVERWR